RKGGTEPASCAAGIRAAVIHRLLMRTDPPEGVVRRSREPETWDRGDYEVERVHRVATVRARIRQCLDDVQKLHNRAGPAVGEDEPQGARLGGADVEEVFVWR